MHRTVCTISSASSARICKGDGKLKVENLELVEKDLDEVIIDRIKFQIQEIITSNINRWIISYRGLKELL